MAKEPKETTVPVEVIESITDSEKINLEVLRLKQATALAEAEKAIAVHEKTKLEYDYFVLKIFMNHNMSMSDSIQQDGVIVRKEK